MRATIVPFRKAALPRTDSKNRASIGRSDVDRNSRTHIHSSSAIQYDSIYERAHTLPIALARQWSIEGNFDTPTILVTISRVVASLRYLIQYILDFDVL